MYKRLEKFPSYEINEFGVVRNSETKYVTTQRMNRSGYLYVQLTDGKKNYVCLVHRLVAETFLPNPNKLPIVNHIDECSVHNSVDNLEWVSYKENSNHGTRNERIVRDRKIPIICFDESGNTIKRYSSRYDASRDLKISEHSIRVAMKSRNKCKKMYWRVADNNSEINEYDENLKWIEQTIKEKNIIKTNKVVKRYNSISAIDDTGTILHRFSSIADAADAMNVSNTAIANAIKNNTRCRCLHWIAELDN